MNVTELRIGNLTDKGIVNAVGYKEGILGCMVIESEIMSFGKWCNYQDLKPIKLTHKLLKKYGFVKQDYFFYKDGICIEDDYTLDGFADMNVPLKYVHQLQNLYFALTGKELKRVDGFFKS